MLNRLNRGFSLSDLLVVISIIAMNCSILSGAGAGRGAVGPATWQTFQKNGFTLEVAPTPVQRTLSVCFFLKTPERMSRVVLEIGRPHGRAVSVEAFGSGDHWNAAFRPHQVGNHSVTLVMTDLAGRTTTIESLGRFRVGDDVGPVSIENHTLIVNGKPFMPVTVDFFPMRETDEDVRADIDFLADRGLTSLSTHKFGEAVREQLNERGMTYIFSGVGSGSSELGILWTRTGANVDGAAETIVTFKPHFGGRQVRENRGAKAFLITSEAVHDISERVLELTEERADPSAVPQYTVKVNTSGLTGTLVVVVRYESVAVGCFTGIEYPLTTSYKGIDNQSRAIPDVRGLGPYIIHIYPNEGSFSSYNMFDQCSDDPHWTQEWDRWLESRYRTIAALNAKWGTAYTAFEEIPAVFTYQSQHGDPNANPDLVLLQPIVSAGGSGKWILADAGEFNAYMLQWIFARCVMQTKKSWGNVVTYTNTIVTNYKDDQWQRAIDLWRWSVSGLDGIGLDLYGGLDPLYRAEVANLLDACDYGGGLWAFMAETPAKSPQEVAAKVKYYWSLGLRGMFFHHWISGSGGGIQGDENRHEIIEMMGRMQRYVDDHAADYVRFTPRKVMTYASHRPTRANAYIYGGYRWKWNSVREGFLDHDWLERILKWYSAPEGRAFRTGQYEVAVLSAERKWLIDPHAMPQPTGAIITAGMANVDAAAGPVADDWTEHAILTPDGTELGKTLWSYKATVPPGARVLAQSETGAPLAWVDESGRIPRVHLAFYPRAGRAADAPGSFDPLIFVPHRDQIPRDEIEGMDPIMHLLQPWLPKDLVIMDDWSVVERDANYIALYAPTAQRFIIDTTDWDITDLNTGQVLPRSRTAEIVLPAEGSAFFKKVPRIKDAPEPLVIVKPAGR